MTLNLISIAQQAVFIAMGIAGMGFLIGFHELGHFIFAKLFNISTPSFSIGMGPKILKKKIGETEFSLSALPLGGYVEIAGMAEVAQGEQKEAHRTDNRSFAAKPYWQKLLVMFGGILFNLIFAYVALSALYYIGMPHTPLILASHKTTQVCQIIPGSPAEQFGLSKGDIITKVNETSVSNNPELLIQTLQTIPGQKAQLTVERSGEILNLDVEVGSHSVANKNQGFIGVDFELKKPNGIFESLKYGFELTQALIIELFKSFKNIFIQRDTKNLCGPLMVISQTVKGAEKGFSYFLLLLAFISINLAVLNIIPLPIMDGGQILFYTLEAIFRRPLPTQVREYIHIASWIGIMLLILYLSFKDIVRMFFTH